MTQKSELTIDLEEQIKNFQHIKRYYNDNNKCCKDQQDLIIHLVEENNIGRENEKKINEQLQILKNVCKNQEISISKLHALKERNNILTCTNAELLKNIENLNNEIKVIKETNNDLFQKEIHKHEDQLESSKRHFEAKVKELENEIELLQASSDLKLNDLQNEMKNMITNYETKLKEAEENEKNLKEQFFMLKNHMTSNMAVYKKKAFEMEQKVKSLEKEKSLYTATKGNFVSAQSVLNIYSNSSQINMESMNHNTNTNYANEEKESMSKFKFRKRNYVNEPININIHNQQFQTYENKSVNSDLNTVVISPVTLTQKENMPSELPQSSNTVSSKNEENHLPNIYKQTLEKLNEKFGSLYNHQSSVSNIQNTNKDFVKPAFPLIKKRKLFNPHNYDYLEETQSISSKE